MASPARSATWRHRARLISMGRPRPSAARDRKQVQVVIARNEKQSAAIPPARERAFDELPALPVVGAVAGDHDGVDLAVGDGARAPEAPQIGIVRGRFEHRRQRPFRRRIAHEGLGSPCSKRQAFAAARSTGSRKSAARLWRSVQGGSSLRGRRARRPIASCCAPAARASWPPPNTVRSAPRSCRRAEHCA